MTGANTFPGIMVVVGIAAAFAVGYTAAKIPRTHQNGGDGLPANSKVEADETSGHGASSRVSGVTSWEKAKETLKKRWEASPSALLDFDLHEETLRLMEKTPVEDLEAWMRQLQSEPETDDDRNIPLLLREMLMKFLAQRGGGEFIRSLAANPLEDEYFDLMEAMDHWYKYDPLSVLEWLEKGNLPEALKDEVEDLSEDALRELSGKNPAEFEKRLTLVDAELRASLLESYSYRRGNIAHRAEILERASNSPQGEAMALWTGLIRREAAEDPDRAYATLAELNISTRDRATLDKNLVWWLLNGFSVTSDTNDNAVILQGWLGRNPDQRVPGGILEAYEKWCNTDPEEARDWIASQPAGLQYDLFAERQIGDLIERDEADHRAGAELAVRITDPSIRGAVLRRLEKSWRAKDAAAADDWKRNLSPADQDRLK